MRGGAGDDFVGFVNKAAGFKKIDGIEGTGATITLVPPGVDKTAVWTNALYISIGQELLATLAISLISDLFFKIFIIPEMEVYGLADLGVLRCRCASKEVKTDVKPLVGFFM
jgi:hypothetical protein